MSISSRAVITENGQPPPAVQVGGSASGDSGHMDQSDELTEAAWRWKNFLEQFLETLEPSAMVLAASRRHQEPKEPHLRP